VSYITPSFENLIKNSIKKIRKINSQKWPPSSEIGVRVLLLRDLSLKIDTAKIFSDSFCLGFEYKFLRRWTQFSAYFFRLTNDAQDLKTCKFEFKLEANRIKIILSTLRFETGFLGQMATTLANYAGSTLLNSPCLIKAGVQPSQALKKCEQSSNIFMGPLLVYLTSALPLPIYITCGNFSGPIHLWLLTSLFYSAEQIGITDCYHLLTVGRLFSSKFFIKVIPGTIM
jgi:hypothetical protein